MGRIGQRLVAIAGWSFGGLICVVLAGLAVYGLMLPECVTDADSRAGRLSIALTVVLAVVVLAGAATVAVWARRRLPESQRFLAGPAFAASLMVSLVLWVPFVQIIDGFTDPPEPTAACF